MDGYTKLQSQRLQDKIDKQASKVQVEVKRLFELVPDHNPYRGTFLANTIDDTALELRSIVVRRTRKS